MPMYSIKPGRGPSLGGVVGGVVGVIFGIGWTILTFVATGSAERAASQFPANPMFGNQAVPRPLQIVHILFPLFGILFVLVSIFSIAYNLYNATAKDRLSLIDVTTDNQEPDPLDQFAHRNDKPNPDVSPQPPTTATAESTGSPDAELESRLAELKSLQARGLITGDEYAAQRQRLLNSI